MASITREPLGLMATIRTKKKSAGIADPLGDVAGAMREKASGYEAGLGPWHVYDDEPFKTTTKFQRKVAAERRRQAEEREARRAAGLPETAEPAVRRPVPDDWPTYDAPGQDAILQLVPLEDCLPRLKPHPSPHAAYQLEEPWFVTEERGRRVAKAAEERAAAEAAASAERDVLAGEVSKIERQ